MAPIIKPVEPDRKPHRTVACGRISVQDAIERELFVEALHVVARIRVALNRLY